MSHQVLPTAAHIKTFTLLQNLSLLRKDAAVQPKLLSGKWHNRCKETNKTKKPLTGPKKLFLMFYFFTSCLNSTVSLPSSSFVFTKDILTQVRKPPENFQLEYELSQSFINSAFSGLKEKDHYITDWAQWYLSAVGRRMSDLQALQNAFTIPFMFQLLKFSIPKIFWVLTFWLMVPLALTCS